MDAETRCHMSDLMVGHPFINFSCHHSVFSGLSSIKGTEDKNYIRDCSLWLTDSGFRNKRFASVLTSHIQCQATEHETFQGLDSRASREWMQQTRGDIFGLWVGEQKIARPTSTTSLLLFVFGTVSSAPLTGPLAALNHSLRHTRKTGRDNSKAICLTKIHFCWDIKNSYWS